MLYYIGFDIGGTKCAVSVGEVSDESVRIVERKEVPTERDPIQTLEKLAPFVAEYQNNTPCNRLG